MDATAAVRQRAGVGRFARGLLQGLAQRDTHNYYILLTTGKTRVALDNTALPVHHSWRRFPVSERLATIGWQRLRLPISPALLAPGANVFFTPDYALPHIGRMPAVVTIHDLSFLVHPECADAHLRRYLTDVVPRSVSRAAIIIAVSETTASAVVRLLGVSRDRVVVVPNAVEARFRPTPPDDSVALRVTLINRFNLEFPYLLTVGTLEPRKNLVRLLQAYALLRSRRGLIAEHLPALVVAGREGWLYEPIFRELAFHGLERWVRFLTRVTDDDLLMLYRGATAFIFPSIYEGFGIPPLEALACGTPVAASGIDAHHEVLGNAALYFDPNDIEAMAYAMERIIEDGALRSHLIPLGLTRAAAFSWQTSADMLEVAFEQAVA